MLSQNFIFAGVVVVDVVVVVVVVVVISTKSNKFKANELRSAEKDQNSTQQKVKVKQFKKLYLYLS